MKLPDFEDFKENQVDKQSFEDLLSEFDDSNWDLEEITPNKLRNNVQSEKINTSSNQEEKLPSKMEKQVSEDNEVQIEEVSTEDKEVPTEDEEMSSEIEDISSESINEINVKEVEVEDDNPIDSMNEEDNDFFGMNDLLPGVDMEEEFEDGTNEETHHKPKEDLDEKAKELFLNIKEKIFNLNIKNNKEKINLKRNNIKLSKKSKILFSTITILIVLLSSVFIYNSLSYEDFNNLSDEVKLKDKDLDFNVNVLLNDFKLNDKKINIQIENKGESSSNILITTKLKEKSKNPFAKSEIICESDIIYLEQGENKDENFTCDKKIDNKNKYKIKTNLEIF